MKPFDLQKACDNHPLVTRDGREVTEFYYFKSADEQFRCIAIIDGKAENFYEDGMWIPNAPGLNHLFLKYEKKKLFIAIEKENIYKNAHNVSHAVDDKDVLNYPDTWQIVEVEIDI